MAMFSTFNGITSGAGVLLRTSTLTATADSTITLLANTTSIRSKEWAPGGAGGDPGSGGGSSAGPGGGGGFSQGTISVTGGESLTYNCGLGGVYKGSPTGAALGGALCFLARGGNPKTGGGTPLNVAGSGGGAGHQGGTGVPIGTMAGGAGGGNTGGAGGNFSNATFADVTTGGGGGTQGAGGSGGTASGSAPSAGNSGSQWTPGTGGAGSDAGCGGSGYYGGGGGGATLHGKAGGGGGSNYITGASTVSTQASGSTVANASDPAYVAGHGNGGAAGSSGQNGLIVIEEWLGLPT